ncbi:MAG TPA: hypothetical protein VHC68_02700 [Candidatus Paceibacterota bacterium]|nr:hypothetical protein [Candidatus Paceibacterota bacterium]
MADNQGQESRTLSVAGRGHPDDFVLEKVIFSNVFDKDIQRIYIYKKAERLAKAIHLVAPGLAASPALRARAESVAVALVDAAILSGAPAREALARELLALSSVLAIARAGGALSSMNAELIAREAQLLLGEVAGYEPPRLTLEEPTSLASLARRAAGGGRATLPTAPKRPAAPPPSKGHIKDSPKDSGRREAILSVIRERGRVYMKDISTVVRGVSEKTIQRELASLIGEGVVAREGERRWTLYYLP